MTVKKLLKRLHPEIRIIFLDSYGGMADYRTKHEVPENLKGMTVDQIFIEEFATGSALVVVVNEIIRWAL